MTQRPTTSIRLPPDIRRLAELHGHGELAGGVCTLLARHQSIMAASLPPLGQEEAKAVCGALKGFPVWAAPELMGHVSGLGRSLALEIADYARYESAEAAQWALAPEAWRELADRAAEFSDLQVLAIGYAVEAFFADHGTDTDTCIRTHFRISEEPPQQ